MRIRTYSELITLSTFEERLQYLKLDGVVGSETFGYNRYVNQQFYRGREWLRVRDEVIVRDMGCDLGSEDRMIYGKIIVHHMNPLLINDIVDMTQYLLNPEYLISSSMDTHNRIHYGNEESTELNSFVERRQNDTCPWKN